MSTIIGIEGLVFAGKTTLSENLGQSLPAAIVHEYGFYTDGLKSFPKYPPESYRAAIEASQFFIDIEQERISVLKRLRLNNPKYIVVDRTYITCLAFDYAAKLFTGFDTYDEVYMLWQRADKIEVDITIYLDVSDAEVMKRVPLRKSKCPNHLLDPEFNRQIRCYLQGQKVVTVNANQNKQQVLEEVIKLVQN